MKKRLLITLLTVSVGTLLYGQSLEWINTIVQTSQNGGASSRHIVADKSGNVYAAGHFGGSMDADPGPGVYTLTSTGISSEYFVIKTDANGHFIWAKSFGNCWQTNGIDDVAIDDSANLYLTGTFQGTMSLFLNGKADSIKPAGGRDAYLIKLDSTGDGKWAFSLGQAGDTTTNHLEDDWGEGLFVDEEGNVYASGSFCNVADFDPGPGTTLIGSPGKYAVYAAKFTSSGNLVWAKEFISTYNAFGRDICTDDSSNVFVATTSSSPLDYDPGPGTHFLPNSINNAGICKLNTNGGFVWAKTPADPDCNNLVWSTNGLILSGGRYAQLMDRSGNTVWTKHLNGPAGQLGFETVSAKNGYLYSYGVFWGTHDFDPGPGTFLMTSNDTPELFLHKMDASGNFVWAVRVGTASPENFYAPSAHDMFVDDSLHFFMTGYNYGKTDFEPGPDTFFHYPYGNYFLKLDSAWKSINLSYTTPTPQNVAIYPNPTSGLIYFDLEPQGPVEVKIINTAGQVVKTYTNLDENTLHVDLSELPSGMYWMEFENAQGPRRAKVVKEY